MPNKMSAEETERAYEFLKLNINQLGLRKLPFVLYPSVAKAIAKYAAQFKQAEQQQSSPLSDEEIEKLVNNKKWYLIDDEGNATHPVLDVSDVTEGAHKIQNTKMRIAMKKGDKVYFVEASDEQVSWGANDDPRELLKFGKRYEIEDVEIHSWHTKIYLKGINGKFNSVHFSKLKPIHNER